VVVLIRYIRPDLQLFYSLFLLRQGRKSQTAVGFSLSRRPNLVKKILLFQNEGGLSIEPRREIVLGTNVSQYRKNKHRYCR